MSRFHGCDKLKLKNILEIAMSKVALTYEEIFMQCIKLMHNWGFVLFVYLLFCVLYSKFQVNFNGLHESTVTLALH
jgi:hypothetical protein